MLLGCTQSLHRPPPGGALAGCSDTQTEGQRGQLQKAGQWQASVQSVPLGGGLLPHGPCLPKRRWNPEEGLFCGGYDVPGSERAIGWQSTRTLPAASIIPIVEGRQRNVWQVVYRMTEAS